MGLFKRILFPVDLSEATNRMVPYVKEVVDKFGAELHIIHVKYIDRYYIATFVDETQLEYTAADENRLSMFVESNFKGLHIPASILQGPPGPEIVRYAEDEKMDLIIMGHNSTGIKRAVFGSVAGYVVKNSQVPVFIVSPSMLKKKKLEQRSVA
ncbi:MAG: universal stress protein [Acidobacteriota bacterium]|jgi:nucleotide-binding universal stress UspA family protein